LDYIIFKNSDPVGKPNLVHYLENNVPIDYNYYYGSRAYLHTNNIEVVDLNLSSEDVQFIFDQPSSTMGLKLKNGIFDFNHAPIFLSTNPLEITAESTAYGSTSILRRFTADISSPTTITIDPGTTLRILDTGNAYSTSTADYLRFRESAQVTVNSGAALIIDASKVVLDKGSINVNAGTVSTQGSNAYLKTYDMKLENGSSLNVGLSTELVSITNGLRLDNSSINTQRVVETGDLYIIGTSALTGGGTVAAGVTLADNSAFTLNLSDVTLKTGNFLDIYGSTVNINNGATFETTPGRSLFMNGTTFNVNDGQFILNGLMGTEDKGTINIESGARMYVGKDSSVILDSTNHTTINAASGSNIVVTGELTGKGYIGVSGSEIDIQSVEERGVKINGVISPGFEQFSDSAHRIGSIITDGKLFIEAQGYPAFVSSQADINEWKNIGYSGGIFAVDIDPTHVQTNDKIIYGAGNVDVTFMDHILVQTPNATLKADDLHQRQFTVIEAQNSGVAGTIRSGYNSYDPSDIKVVADGSIPALISFTVVDNSTNGKPDVTLLAEKSILNFHKKVDPARANFSTTGNLLSNIYTSSTSGATGSSAIVSAFNSLTNSQVSSSIGSIQPEPFSSYMTVSLEQVDWVMGNVMAKTFNHFGDKKNFWVDASFADGKVDGANGLGNFSYSIKSSLLGVDLFSSDIANVGLFGGFTRQTMSEVDRANQNFNSENYHFGAYFYNQGVRDLVVTGVLAGSYSKHRSSRLSYLGSYSGQQKSDFDGYSVYGSIQASLNAGRLHGVTLMPNLGLGYANVFQNRVEESGNDLRLIIDKGKSKMLSTFIGLDAVFDPLEFANSLSPQLFMRYEHDWSAAKKSAHEMVGALAIAPDYKDTFLGQNRGANHFILGAGLRANASQKLQLNAGIFRTVNEHGRELSFSFDMLYKF
jgi:hypothetical protein